MGESSWSLSLCWSDISSASKIPNVSRCFHREFVMIRTDCVLQIGNDELQLKVRFIIDRNLRMTGGSLHFLTFDLSGTVISVFEILFFWIIPSSIWTSEIGSRKRRGFPTSVRMFVCLYHFLKFQCQILMGTHCTYISTYARHVNTQRTPTTRTTVHNTYTGITTSTSCQLWQWSLHTISLWVATWPFLDQLE